MTESKIGVAVLGCTGIVGQRLLSLLANHPFFEVAEVAASEKSAGKSLDEAIGSNRAGEIDMNMAGMKVLSLREKLESRLVFSCLPGEVAGEVEERLAKEGKVVISKASAHRMEPDVPLLIPEVKPEQLSLIEIQRSRRDFRGALITDPNCTTIGLAIALKPIHDAFGVREVIVTTMQALSGAGLPGVPALSIADNVIPFIEKEEEKVCCELKKILGRMRNGSVADASFSIHASCNRVPVSDGHLASVHVRMGKKADIGAVKKALASFSGLPQKLHLPSAPERPIMVKEEADRPQPRLDRDNGNGMAVTVGRVREGIDSASVAFTILSHNLVRGAAGASVLDAELLVKNGMLGRIVGV